MKGYKAYIPFLLLILSFGGYALSASRVDRYRQTNRLETNISYIPPAGLIKVASLDYKGIASKLLLFRGMTYYGERAAKNKRQDLAWIYNSINASTILDPYNIDAYYFAQAVLPWENNMAAETNKILERGLKKRDWDFYIPFFIGFNYFHFMGDNSKAAEYFDKAAKLNPSLISLALKFHYRANEITVAISILNELYNNTGNEKIKRNIKIRIEAYTEAHTLYKAVQTYKKKYNGLPNSLNQLVAKGIIGEIPKDPYGGNFYYDAKEDRIKTTSKFSFKK